MKFWLASSNGLGKPAGACRRKKSVEGRRGNLERRFHASGDRDAHQHVGAPAQLLRQKGQVLVRGILDQAGQRERPQERLDGAHQRRPFGLVRRLHAQIDLQLRLSQRLRREQRRIEEFGQGLDHQQQRQRRLLGQRIAQVVAALF